MIKQSADVATDEARVQSECVRTIAQARGACFELGISPRELGAMFMEEALLAWMIDGLSEHEIHERIADIARRDLRKWFLRARLATGQCDCVRELHFEGMEQVKSLFGATSGSRLE